MSGTGTEGKRRVVNEVFERRKKRLRMSAYYVFTTFGPSVLDPKLHERRSLLITKKEMVELIGIEPTTS